ncbi:hypothetical protein LFZ49_00680 [Salmonella enterica subsp. arizonae serovar 62:z36:- str. 5335/86]|nr:hypothetical protein LFZ49_00680 [Salmonella enterica subsp. arizonae serovar 62:z36:- str. 5335/86]
MNNLKRKVGALCADFSFSQKENYLNGSLFKFYRIITIGRQLRAHPAAIVINCAYHTSVFSTANL